MGTFYLHWGENFETFFYEMKDDSINTIKDVENELKRVYGKKNVSTEDERFIVTGLGDYDAFVTVLASPQKLLRYHESKVIHAETGKIETVKNGYTSQQEYMDWYEPFRHWK